MAFFRGRVPQFAWGLLVGSWAIAGCAGMTHSMDMAMDSSEPADSGAMEHSPVNPGSVDHHSPASHSPMAPAKAEPVMDHDEMHSIGGQHPSGMHHAVLAIPPGQPRPQVTLKVEPDAMRGWNLHLETTHFQFAPERVNQASLTTEGHAHLFIDGEKTTRLYAPWYYIPALPQGEHELRVELNGNGHETLTVDGHPVGATVKVNVPAPSK